MSKSKKGKSKRKSTPSSVSASSSSSSDHDPEYENERKLMRLKAYEKIKVPQSTEVSCRDEDMEKYTDFSTGCMLQKQRERVASMAQWPSSR